MKTILRICIITGYILFGSFWVKSTFDVVTRNSYADLFKFSNVSTSNISFLKKNSELIVVNYKFEINSIIYSGEKTVSQEVFDENVEEINICYNTMIPSVNYMMGWQLKSYYRFMFIFFTFFLLLIIIVDSKVNKDKWIRKYIKAIRCK